jgi:N-acetylglucosamine repressor
MKKATRQHTKDHNTRLVLQVIYAQGQLSRAEVARITRLTRPTVSSIVAELIASGMIEERGPGVSGGGKRPTLLGVAYDAHHLLCVDLGSEEFRGAVVNLRGDIRHQLAVPAPQTMGEAALQLVYGLVDGLTAVSPTRPLGIGIGAPGLVNVAAGIIGHAVNLHWRDLPLRDLLAERYAVPVYVANDSHMAALAEYTFGPPRDSQNLIVIKIGRGVGAGIVLGGRPFYGDGMGAGEIGHVVVEGMNGRLCTCGNEGCLETVASTAAILQQARDVTGRPEMVWADVVAAYEGGETAVVTLLHTVAAYLGRTIAYLVGAVNVHHVVLAGRVREFGEGWLARIQAEMQRHVMPTLAAQTQICYAAFGPEIVILGCSAMILHEELGIIS